MIKNIKIKHAKMQGGPLKFEVKDIMTSAENELLKKKLKRGNTKYSLKEYNVTSDTDDAEFIKIDSPPLANKNDEKSGLSPNIMFRTDVGYTKYISEEGKSVIYDSSSKKPKLQIPELTVRKSELQPKEKQNKGSRTMQMTQSIIPASLAEADSILENEVILSNEDITDILEVEVIEDNDDSFNKINSHVALTEQIIGNALNTDFSTLLFRREINILKIYQKITNPQKYYSSKLFTHQIKWYNACKFAESIHLTNTEFEIKELIGFLKKMLIVKADYTSEPIVDLLHLLSLDDVKAIHNGLRLKSKHQNKPTFINSILEYTNKQTTVDPTMSLDQKVRQMIYKKLGEMVHINPEFYTAFYKAHLLYTFTNPEFSIPSGLYLRMNELKYGNVVYPDYNCRNDIVFDSAEEFSEFYKARSYKDEVVQALEKKGDVKYTTLYNLSKEIVKEFTDVLRKEDSNVTKAKSKHLIRFTAGHLYAGALSILCKQLGAKHPLEVREWLEILIGQIHFYQKKRGLWYSHLSVIYNTHLKEHNKAIQILIDGLKDEAVSLVDRSDIIYRARGYCKKKKLQSEELVLHLSSWDERIPNSESFPFITIQALGNDSSEAARRGDYKYMDSNGEISYLNVEEIAIKHYKNEKGFTEGVHCEGALIHTVFYVLFWDIIYTDGIPCSFICKLQYLPLDFYTPEFYDNRKLIIDRRLQDIKCAWSLEDLKSHTFQTWDSVLNAKFVNIPFCIQDAQKLYKVINCIGREAVSGICERLVQHFGNHRAGMPDLFVFNENRCKFVEVKGPGDKLSPKQKLWLSFLLSTGVDAEVCHVTKVGGLGRK